VAQKSVRKTLIPDRGRKLHATQLLLLRTVRPKDPNPRQGTETTLGTTQSPRNELSERP